MARPQKQGLEYFALDVKLDDEVELIEAQHGLEGFAILIKLYQKIYSKGFYLLWDEKEQILFSSKVSSDREAVIKVVDDCIKWGIFNEKMYRKFGILTSRRIQDHFSKAIYKRMDVFMEKEYLLIDISSIKNIKLIVVSDISNADVSIVSDISNADTTVVSDDRSTQSKVKESKVKKSKEDKVNSDEFSLSSAELNQIITLWNSLSLQDLTAIKDKRLLLLKTRLKDHGKDSINICIEKIRVSNFLKGQNDRSWIITFDWLIKPSNYIKVLEGNYNDKKPISNNIRKQNIQGSYSAVSNDDLEDMLAKKRESVRNEVV